MTKKTTQRARPRIDLRVQVRAENQSRLQQFYSRNLSAGGIFLELDDEPPPIGSTMKLTFEVPGLGKPISADAQVLHHHSFEAMNEKFQKVTRHGMGLRFVKLEKTDEDLIQRYVTGKDLHVRS